MSLQVPSKGNYKIPVKYRWAIIVTLLLMSFNIVRYPIAVQNFLRADGLLALNLREQAIDHYRRSILLFPEFIQAYSMLAWCYEMKGELTLARKVYENGLTREQPDEMLFFHYIIFLWKNNDAKRAVEVARSAYSQFPDTGPVLRVYGNTVEKAGYESEAAEIWRCYLQRYPDDGAIKEKLEKLEKSTQ
ncbi:MAG: tetratricopeptide repeat protein [Candidatus Xenobiia bacterium LiM19]